MIDYSIIIPCYNESPNLTELLDGFNNFIGDVNAEVILVDNGSTDSTAKMKTDFLKKHSFLKWVTVEKNIGYGNGILQGIINASGKYIAYTHADLQTNPQDVYKAILVINQLKDDNVFLKGTRMGRTFIDRTFSKGMEIIVYLIIGVKMHEINSQPTFFSRQLVNKIQNPPVHWGFDLYLYHIALLNKYSIHRIEVLFPNRKAGKSNWNNGFLSRLNLSMKMIKYCYKIKRHENN